MIHTKSYNQAVVESLLIHFISLSAFLALEYVTDMLLFWFPFYSSLKLLLVLWLSIPFFGGSRIFYLDHIQPFLDRHEKELDVSISKFKGLFQDQVDQTKSSIASNIQTSVMEWVSYGYTFGSKIVKSQLVEKKETIIQNIPPVLKSKNSFSRKRVSSISQKKSSSSLSPLQPISPDKRNSRHAELLNENESEVIEDLTLNDYYDSDFDQ
jgi:hypothetical protein